MRFVSLLLILGFLFAERPAAARPDLVAILELQFKDVPPALTDALRIRLQEALKAEGYRVLVEEAVDQRMREIGIAPGCSLGPCLAPLGSVLLAERALSGGVAAQGSSYDLVLTLMETGGGTILAQVNDRCEVCTFKEVEEAMTRVTQELHKKSLVYLSTRASLTVTSTPSSATVLIDNLPAGKTPVTLVLPPGRHLIEVAAKNDKTFKNEMQLDPGKSYTIKAALLHKWPGWTKPAPATATSRRGFVPSWLKWIALGGGAILGGVGGGLWALDGQETSDPRYVHETRAAGMTLVGVGAAAVIGASIIYLLEPRSESRAPRPPSEAALQMGTANAQ